MFKKIKCLSSGKNQAREQEKVIVVDELRHKYSLRELLKLAEMARSTFYYYLKKYKSNHDKYHKIKKEIFNIFNENKGRYGYRRITLKLKNRGFNINHKTVSKFMNILGIKSIQRPKRRYNSYQGSIGKIANNLLKRDFKADKPNQKWVTDVTEFKVHDRKLYLSPIIDLFNGEIISYNLSKHPTFQQITDMLEKAFIKIKNNTNLILHSDQGWQYQMKIYQKMLKEKGIKQSMSRKGNCLDNSCAENFFGILKSELFYPKEKEYKNIEELEKDIKEYIEYYNNSRIKSKLKGMSPIQYRKHSLIVA
ncbi:MAG: IS3 family transposase [Clostridiales bacterium]|nr:IS3 family transposase [Clostridiales bacterium]